jgi:hypothetical protein
LNLYCVQWRSQGWLSKGGGPCGLDMTMARLMFFLIVSNYYYTPCYLFCVLSHLNLSNTHTQRQNNRNRAVYTQTTNRPNTTSIALSTTAAPPAPLTAPPHHVDHSTGLLRLRYQSQSENPFPVNYVI